MLEAVGFLVGLELVPLLGVLLLLGVACGSYEQGWAIIHAIPPYLPALICVLVWLIPLLITKALFDKTEFPNDATSVVAKHMAWYSFVLLILAYGGAWALHHLPIFLFLYMPFAALVLLGGGLLTLYWIIEARSYLRKWFFVRKEQRKHPESYASRVEYAKAVLRLSKVLRITLYKNQESIQLKSGRYIDPHNISPALIGILENAWLNNKDIDLEETFEKEFKVEFLASEDDKKALGILIDAAKQSFLDWRFKMVKMHVEGKLPKTTWIDSSMPLEPLL